MVNGNPENKPETTRLSDMLSSEIRDLLPMVHVNMPWKYIHHYLDAILELRMNVEIGLDAEQLDRTTPDRFRETAAILQRRGCRISVHGPFWDLNPGSVDPLIRQVSRSRLSQFMDVIEIFAPVRAVCHTGFDPRHHHGQQEFWRSESLKVWEYMVRRMERLGVPLLLENVWEDGPEIHRSLFQLLPSPCFGFCFDVGHQHSFSKSTLMHWLDALMGHIQEVHLHDNDGSHDQHLPIGKGTIDFKTLFKALKENRVTPLLTVEPHTSRDLPETLQGLRNILVNDLHTSVV